MQKIRLLVQILSSFISNPRLWITPENPIYKGPLKHLCFPGINCYSCPAAVFACPLGALQNAFTTLRFNLKLGASHLGLYVIGSLGIIGSLVGRLPCGWFCPFGLFQDLCFKVRLPKVGFPRFLDWGRYFFLILFVIVLPIFFLDSTGFGQTWFCKYVCPAGTLEAGLPLIAIVPDLRSAIGTLFFSKFVILIIFILWSIVTLRPFCRAVCPLGLIFGLFNRFSWLRLKFNKETCVECHACELICPTGVYFAKGEDDINSTKCIRCLKCLSLCPGGAVELEFSSILKECNEYEKGCACNQK